jgi:hypothetical protein
MSAESIEDAEADSLDVEINQLLPRDSSPSTRQQRSHCNNGYHRRPSFRLMCCLLVMSLVACNWVVPLILPEVIRKASILNGGNDDGDDQAVDESFSPDASFSSSSSSSSSSSTKEEYIIKTFDSRMGISCPPFVELPSANSDGNQRSISWYDSKRPDISNNVSEYLRVFQQMEEYDNWGHSYDEIRRGMHYFKSKYVLPYLSDNMTIYESSFGFGLNLYMTLALSQNDVQGLVIYGNEYSGDSVRVANQLLNSAELPGSAKFGLLCQADPANLQHVPESSMDLVYSGYIAPLPNPLGLDIENPDELYTKYAELCEAKENTDPDQFQRNTDAQHKQNAWYRSQVEEMIRIAKPGAPIMVEQVSYPLCEVLSDGGGIYQSFWKSNIDIHAWDIDTDSVKFVQDSIFRHRYHVFMRKNNQ